MMMMIIIIIMLALLHLLLWHYTSFICVYCLNFCKQERLRITASVKVEYKRKGW